jgi:hypothetical protein
MKTSAAALSLLLSSAVIVTGCDDKSSSDAAPSSSPATAKSGATKPAADKPSGVADAKAPTCKEINTHIVELGEAAKKEGIIRRSNIDKMIERCEKANNIAANGEVVSCIMEAKDHDAFTACKDIGKLLGPW